MTDWPGTQAQQPTAQWPGTPAEQKWPGTAAEQQTATTGEITNNIHQISGVIQETAKSAQDSAQAASMLTGLAEDLQQLVGQFKVAV